MPRRVPFPFSPDGGGGSVLRLVWMGGVLAVLSFTLPLPGHAQDKLSLTLEQSVATALEHSPELAVSKNEYDKAGAGVWQAWSTVLPRLDGYASLQHSWEIQTSRIPNFLKPMLGPVASADPRVDQMPDFVDIAFGLENTMRYGATVTQPLFLGGAGIAGINMANAGERMAEHSLALRRQSLILDAATAFYAVLLAEELVRVQENALVQARANLEPCPRNSTWALLRHLTRCVHRWKRRRLSRMLSRRAMRTSHPFLRYAQCSGSTASFSVAGEFSMPRRSIRSTACLSSRQWRLSSG